MDPTGVDSEAQTGFLHQARGWAFSTPCQPVIGCSFGGGNVFVCVIKNLLYVWLLLLSTGSVMSDCLRPHELKLCPRDSPGKNTGEEAAISSSRGSS